MNATVATRKRRTEGNATNANVSVNVAAPVFLPPPKVKLAPNLEPARAAIESLPTKTTQDHIAGLTAAMVRLFDDVKKKEAGLSKFEPSLNETDLTIPVCLRTMKNPLSGSKAVLGTEQYERLTTKADDLLQNYRVEMTKVMMGVTELEIKQKTAKLISAMHECVADMANLLTIFKLKTNQQGWTTGLTEKEIAGHAAMRMYEQLGNNFSRQLGAERNELTQSFRREHLPDGLREIDALTEEERRENNDALFIQDISLTLTRLLPALTIDLWASEDKKKFEKRVDQDLATYLANKKQSKANADVTMAIADETPANPTSVLAIVRKENEAQNKRHAEHIRQMTQELKKERRKNSSGRGGVGQPSKATKSGTKPNGRSGDGKKVSFQETEATTLTKPNQPANRPRPKPKGKGKGKEKRRNGNGNRDESSNGGQGKSKDRS